MHEKVLTPNALKLLTEFNDEIKKFDFYLGGGSGLALQLGHRLSEDLDFFSSKEFQPEILIKYLESHYKYEEILITKGALNCFINDIKISFFHYDVPLVYPVKKFRKIKIADWRDIMAEKFKTLSQRGSKKDFYDIYFCFKYKNLSIPEGIKIFKTRFSGTGINYYHILKSLVYFEDAEKEPELNLIKKVSWQTVKNFFIENLKEFEKYLLET